MMLSDVEVAHMVTTSRLRVVTGAIGDLAKSGSLLAGVLIYS